MNRLLVAGVAAFILIPLGARRASAQTPPIQGNWEISWDMPGGPRTITLDLKQEGHILTGTAVVPGRAGPDDGGNRQLPISEGRIEGDHIFFQVRMENGQGRMRNQMQGRMDAAETVMQFTGVVGSHGVMGGFLTGGAMMQGVMTGNRQDPAMEIPFKGFRR